VCRCVGSTAHLLQARDRQCVSRLGRIRPRLECALFFLIASLKANRRSRCQPPELSTARLAQSAERKALNLVVVGSSPTVGVFAGTRPTRRHDGASCGRFVRAVRRQPARLAADSGSFRPVAPRRDSWLRGVTVNALDSESRDRGSFPRGAFPGREQSGRPSFPPRICKWRR
jgi:hypothetical protein